MYETVLWATDASPGADGALVEAVKVLQPGGRLIAFHCDERFLGTRVGGLSVAADELDAKMKLRGQVDELNARGIDAQLVIDVSHQRPVGEIAKAAEEYGADVVVCGTRGFGIVAGAVAGSVAMRLPHVAGCPVLVVSEKAMQRAELATV
jgi:nucleotide-binding universal stress UspA family protein